MLILYLKEDGKEVQNKVYLENNIGEVTEVRKLKVSFLRYNLMETMPLSMMKHMEEEVPPVFMILDTYDKDIKVSQDIIHHMSICKN